MKHSIPEHLFRKHSFGVGYKVSMNLKKELNLSRSFSTPEHEMGLNIILTGTLIAKEGDRILRPFGLTDSQFQILALLRDKADGGAMTQTELGNILLVNRSNITGLIDRMEKAGWVKRKPDSKDRRVNQISLSRKGQNVLVKAEKEYQERMAEVIGALSKKDYQQMAKSLQKLRDRIHQAEN